MDDKGQKDLTQSRAVLEMLLVANEYCVFMEKVESSNMEKVVSFFVKIAPLLYLRGNLLPDAQPESDFIADRYVTEEQWEEVFKSLRKVFGPNDVYFSLNDTHDTIETSLSDNLSDIYQDLKDFVMVYQKNTFASRMNALTQVRFLFFERWGKVLLHALLACHNLSLKQTSTIDDDFEDAW